MRIIYIIVLFFLLFSFGYGSDDILKDVNTGRAIEFDKEGNLYTPNDQHTIHKYSPSGKFILKFGRRGRGPGDIQRLGGFTVHPITQNIYVTEFYMGNLWISIFSPKGKFVDTWDTKLDRLEWQALRDIKFDNKGNAYIEAAKSKDRTLNKIGVVGSDNRIFKIKPDGTIERTIYRLMVDHSANSSPTGMNMTIPFHCGLDFDVRDNIIAVVETHHNYIQLFSTDGKPVKKLILPYKMEKVHKEDINEWVKWLHSNRHMRKQIQRGLCDPKFWKKNMPFPEYKHLTVGVTFDKLGNLLVIKRKGFSMEGKDKILYKVNIETGKVTTHNFGKDVYLLAVDRNYFYAFKNDEDDEPVTYRINRKQINF